MQIQRNGDVSFWFADMGGIPGYRPSLPGDLQVDVCIIGAGFTGLWTAYYLKMAKPELTVVVIEKEFAGFGASGRNGGWCSGEFGGSREKYLETGSRESVTEFQDLLKSSVREVGAVIEDENIDCDFLMTDCLTYACTPAQLKRLQDSYETARSWGVPNDQQELITGRRAQQLINVPNALGALVLHNVARLQPAKLVRGLAEVVERMGVAIYERTTVTSIVGGQVATDRGLVKASRIVRATEGFTHGIAGQERQWIPLNSAMIVTEPVPASVWDEIGWKDSQLLADASHAYCYAQRTRDNRIAMGGRGIPYRYGSKTDVRGQTQLRTVEKLRDILYRMLPQTRNLKLDHAWCGVLGVPRDWCATVGMDPVTGVGWAGGYVGRGVSTSNLAGRTMADLVLDRRTNLTRMPWVNRMPRKWEVEPFRWLGVHGMYWLYNLADRDEHLHGGNKTSSLAHVANWLTGR